MMVLKGLLKGRVLAQVKALQSLGLRHLSCSLEHALWMQQQSLAISATGEVFEERKQGSKLWMGRLGQGLLKLFLYEKHVLTNFWIVFLQF